MAITITVGVDVYGTVAEADTYHTQRGNSIWLAYTSDDKSARLVRATDYIDGRWGGAFVGVKTDTDQPLEWPRTSTPQSFEDDEIPVKLKEACFEYAFRADGVDALAPDPAFNDAGVSMVLTQEKVGPIERRFATAAGAAMPAPVQTIRPYPAADMKLRGLVVSSGGVIRG